MLSVESTMTEVPRRRSTRRMGELLALSGPYLGLLLVVSLFSLLTWQQGQLQTFLSWDNLKIVSVHTAITAGVALGMTMIMISGGIDLSVGYVVSLITVVMMLTYRLAVLQPWQGYLLEQYGWEVPFLGLLAGTASLWAILSGVGTGGLAGLANGFFITRFKIAPFIVTLGTLGVARGLAQYLSNGRPVAFPDPAKTPSWVPWLGAIEPEPIWLGVSPAVWSVLFLGVLVAVLLRYTVLGRYCYAIGSNEATARLCGVNVARTKILIYTLAGLLTGWAGVLQFCRSGYGLHDVKAGLELEVIAAVVIGGGNLSGGEGTVMGTLVGALFIAILDNGCSKLRLPMELRYIVIGAIIVGVAALNSWRQRRMR